MITSENVSNPDSNPELSYSKTTGTRFGGWTSPATGVPGESTIISYDVDIDRTAWCVVVRLEVVHVVIDPLLIF